MPARFAAPVRFAKILLTAASLLIMGAALPAQQTHSLIPDQIDNQNLVTLKGNTPIQARAENDRGAVSGNLPMNRMILVLKRSASQETALKAAIQAMHDPKSQQYHKWLTPAQFGQQYGASTTDLARITAWLKGNGFQVNSVAAGRGSIEFSGTADVVSNAFHTQIHSYVVKGAQHYANASDPKIPAAITPVVSGILSLHNFVKQSSARILGKGQLRADKRASIHTSGAVHAKSDFVYKPNFTSSGTNYVGPGDLWTIYNATPLLTASQSRIDGTGQTVAIVGRSDVEQDDIQGFRSLLLPAPFSSTFPFTQILNGPDPGVNDDQTEQTLDVEYSSAMAPGAQIDLVVSGSTNTTDGIDLSAQYIVDNNLAPVMSTSYGLCEALMGTGNDFYNSLWEQAAAQGITALVSSGDNGSAGCDIVGPSGDATIGYVADEGLQVNGLASTPYNVAVGGNEFTDDSSTYWNSNNSSSPAPYTSALSYVPEKVWNESCSPLVCGNEDANIAAGSGGASGCFTPTLDSSGNIVSCSDGYAAPDWQTGVAGLPGDNKRHLPDISLTAAQNDGYMVCLDGSCDDGGFYAVGGTSASSPSFAGVMALINQKTLSRQGQANYTLYRLAGSQFGTADSPNTSQLTACNASNGNTVATSCIFQDVTTGTNAVPCDGGTLNCDSSTSGEYGALTAYEAGTGYDSATGLGSVNVANLVNHWNDTTETSTATTLALGATTSTFGAPLSISVTVKPTTGTGTPTGSVALITDSTLPGATGAGAVTLANGSYNNTISSLPGGSYNLSARYSGDTSFATSTSASSKITVTPATSSTTLTVTGYDPITQVAVTGSSIPYGSVIDGSVALGGVSGQAVPSGTVSFYNGGAKLSDTTTSADGTASYSASSYAVGSYSWKASYAGNSNYNSSASSAVSFTVGKASTALKMLSNTSYVVGSNSAILTVIVTDESLLTNPTGSVTFSVNGKSLGSVAVVSYTDPSTGASDAKASITVNATSLTAGANSITASFSGDSNYAGSVSTALSIGYGASSASNTIALTATPASPTVDQAVTLMATVTTGGIAATAGTVEFFDGSTQIGSVQVAGSNAASGYTTGTAVLKTILGTGSHTLSATYLGILSAPVAVTSASDTVTVSGSMLSTLAIAAAANASDSANYDLNGTITGYGFAIPNANVDFSETSVISNLGSAKVDATTATHTLLAPTYVDANDSAGAEPSQTVLADFNGDGILDMASSNASFSEGTMSVMIGKGDGTFNTPVLYQTGIFAVAINTGDFNNDGIIDIAVTNNYESTFSHGYFSIFLGNGDGTFQGEIPVNIPGYPTSTAVADFNRDGILDIATVQYYPSQITVGFGNGDGTFQDPINYEITADAFAPNGLVGADFDGDGIPDLAESNTTSNTIGIFLNSGDGTFSAKTYVTSDDPQWISSADVNGDGKQDLIISNYSDQEVSVKLGVGDGTFKGGATYPLSGYATALGLTDMDGDGKLDIVAEYFYPAIGIGLLKGNGKGVFGSETIYATNQGHGYAISIGDLNGDGTSDIVSADINSGDSATQAMAIMLNVTQAKATLSDVAIAGPVSVAQQVQGVYSGDSSYGSAVSAAITVNGSGGKAQPSIVWSPASPWGAGVALQTNVLNATVNGNIAGAITYTAQSSGTTTAVTVASTLAAGTYTLTATFTPVDATNYTTATATRTLVVQQADFGIETDQQTLTITAGSSGTVNVSVPALYGFTGTVTLDGASPLPGGFTITSAPATISAGGTSVVTIQTTGLSTTATATNHDALRPWITGGGIALSCLLIFPLARRRKSAWVALIGMATMFGMLSGCGGGSGFSTATVTLSSNTTKAASGASVSLTATVSVQHKNAGGNVTFYNGSTALGSAVIVSNGTATLAVNSLPVGLNSLTAVYSGDSHDSSATSPALTQLITGQTEVAIQGTSGSITHATTVQIILQ